MKKIGSVLIELFLIVVVFMALTAFGALCWKAISWGFGF